MKTEFKTFGQQALGTALVFTGLFVHSLHAEAGQIGACPHPSFTIAGQGNHNALPNYQLNCRLQVSSLHGPYRTFENRTGASLTNFHSRNPIIVQGRNFWTATFLNRGSVQSSFRIERYGNLDNQGTVHLNGTTTNSGTITMRSGSNFSMNSGVRLENQSGGVLNLQNNESHLRLSLHSGSTLNNTAFLKRLTSSTSGSFSNALVNSGTFKNSGVLQETNVDNRGRFTNNVLYRNNIGSFINRSGATLDNNDDFINARTLTIEAGSTFDNDGGTVTNTSTGVINLWADQTLGAPESGTFVLNSGSILNNNANLTVAGFQHNDGTLNNNALLSISGELDNRGGAINNFGSLILTGDLDNGGGTLNNESGGVIEVVADYTLDTANTGNFNLKSGGTLNIDTAVLTNASGNALSNQGTIVNRDVFWNDGTFDNEGTFNAESLTVNSAEGTWNNKKTLTIRQTPDGIPDFANFGTFNNEAGGVVKTEGLAGFLNIGGSTLNNAGTFVNGRKFRNASNFDFNNTGTFINEYEFDNWSGANTVGGTFVNQGTVIGNGGGVTFTGDVSGAGDYTGNVTINGNFRPGNSPALVSAETLTFGASSALFMEIGGYGRGSEYDAIDALSVTLDGLLNVALLDLNNGFIPMAGYTFDLIIADQIFGNFSSFSFAALSNGLGWATNLFTNNLGQMVYQLVVQAQEASVPTPGALTLVLAGLLAVSVFRKSRKRT